MTLDVFFIRVWVNHTVFTRFPRTPKLRTVWSKRRFIISLKSHTPDNVLSPEEREKPPHGARYVLFFFDFVFFLFSLRSIPNRTVYEQKQYVTSPRRYGFQTTVEHRRSGIRVNRTVRIFAVFSRARYGGIAVVSSRFCLQAYAAGCDGRRAPRGRGPWHEPKRPGRVVIIYNRTIGRGEGGGVKSCTARRYRRTTRNQRSRRTYVMRSRVVPVIFVYGRVKLSWKPRCLCPGKKPDLRTRRPWYEYVEKKKSKIKQTPDKN